MATPPCVYSNFQNFYKFVKAPCSMPPFSLKNATRTQISIRSSITIHFYTGVTPATYRLDAFRKNYI